MGLSHIFRAENAVGLAEIVREEDLLVESHSWSESDAKTAVPPARIDLRKLQEAATDKK